MHVDLHQTSSKPATSSYSLHFVDTTAGIDDIIPSPQTTQLSGSKKDARGLYLAVPTTGTFISLVSCLDRCAIHSAFSARAGKYTTEFEKLK